MHIHKIKYDDINLETEAHNIAVPFGRGLALDDGHRENQTYRNVVASPFNGRPTLFRWTDEERNRNHIPREQPRATYCMFTA